MRRSIKMNGTGSTSIRVPSVNLLSPSSRHTGTSITSTATAAAVAAQCPMIALTPFLRVDPSSGMVRPVRRGYASAFATALAVQHLNDGDGSIIPDVAGVRCNRNNIHFTLEYINTNMNLGTALMGLASRLEEETPQHRPSPCVFLGVRTTIN